MTAQMMQFGLMHSNCFKIIGEGGNLGFTQNARIEADQNGVRLNTDGLTTPLV